MVSSLYEQAGQQIAERVADADTSLGRLLGCIEANLAFVAEHGRHVRAVMEVVANLRRPDGEPTLGPPGGAPVAAHLQRLVEQGQAAGDFAPTAADGGGELPDRKAVAP